MEFHLKSSMDFSVEFSQNSLENQIILSKCLIGFHVSLPVRVCQLGRPYQHVDGLVTTTDYGQPSAVPASVKHAVRLFVGRDGGREEGGRGGGRRWEGGDWGLTFCSLIIELYFCFWRSCFCVRASFRFQNVTYCCSSWLLRSEYTSIFFHKQLLYLNVWAVE